MYFEMNANENQERRIGYWKRSTVSFSAPGKSWLRRKKIVAAADDFDEETIRRLIYNFYTTEKQRLTLKYLLPVVLRKHQSPRTPRRQGIAKKILDEVGFWLLYTF
jgi:hypothetical protein